MCIIAVTITLTMICLWLKNKLSRSHMLPLQARGLSLPSPIELDVNKAYTIHVSENEAYATTLAHRIKDTTAKQ